MLKRNNKNLRPITPIRSINGATFLPAVRTLHPLDPIPPIGYKSDAIVYGVNAMSLQPEAANSFADIITGGPLGTSQLRRTLDKNNLGFFKEIPLLNKVVGALALSKNQFIDPVFDKGMSQGGKEVFLNVLTNASETLDLFSNLIKSQWELAGGHAGLDTLASAWGVGEHNTRKVYNFNTGNFLGDVALEVISDPVNWVSLGAKALAGTTIKAGTDVIEETVEATVKNNVDDLSKILLKDLSKEAVDDFSERLTKEITEQIIKQETKDITFDSLKYFLKETTVQEFEEASQALLKLGANSGIFEATVKEALEKSITASSKLFHAYNAANAFKEFFKKNVEDTLSHLAYAPVYYPYKGLKKFIESNEVLRNFAKRIHNKLISFLDEYTKKNDIVDVEKVYTHSSADAFVESENYFGKLISDNKPLLEKLGVSAYTLQEEWLAMLRTLTRDQMHTSIDELRTMFIRWLALHRNPAIKEMSLTVAEQSFLNQMSVAPLIIRLAELRTLDITNTTQINRVLNHLKNKITFTQKLELLNDQILNYNNVHYGIGQLPAFIKKVMINSDSIPFQQRVLIKQLIDDLGINIKNYKQIADVLNNKDSYKNYENILKRIIKKTQDSPAFFDDEMLNSFLQTSKSYNNSKPITALKTFFEKELKELGNTTYEEYLKYQVNNITEAVARISQHLNENQAYTYLKSLLRQTQFIDTDVLEANIQTWFDIGGVRVLDDYSEHFSDLLLAQTQFIELTNNFVDALTNGKTLPMNILKWYDMLEFNAKTIDNLSDVFKTYSQAIDNSIAKEVGSFLNNAKELYKVLLSDDLKIDLADYIDDVDQFVKVQLSYKGMYDIFNQHLTLTEDKDFKEIMHMLMNPQSELRTRIIPNLLQIYDDAHLANLSQALRETIVQIDMFTAAQKIFNTDILVPNLTKEQIRYIKTVVFDAIKNNSNFTIQQITDDSKIVQQMLDFINYNIEYHMFPIDNKYARVSFVDDFVNGALARTNTQRRTINIKKHITVSEFFDYIKGNTATETSLQKQKVFKQLAAAGYTEDYLHTLIKTDRDAQLFVYYHELSHIFNEDVIAPGVDIIAIEYRATLDAIKQLQTIRSLMDKIMDNTEYMLNTYLDDINVLTNADHVIYSMYSHETISNIERLVQYYKNTIIGKGIPAQAYGEYEALMTYLQKFADATEESLNEIAAKNEDLISYVRYHDATRQVLQDKLSQNLMEASVASEMYSVKRFVNKEIEKQFNLNRKMFIGSNSEYLMLTDRLAGIKKYHIITDIDEKLMQDQKHIAQIREALIRTYGRSEALFAMTDARTYFESLNPLQIYYWEQVTRGSLSKRNARAFNNILHNIKTKSIEEKSKTFSELGTMLQEIVSDKEYINDYAFDNVIDLMSNVQFTEVKNYVDITLRSLPNSIEGVKEYKDAIANFIKREVRASSDIFKRIQQLEQYLVRDPKDYHLLKEIYYENAANRAIAVSQMTPKELARYIDVNTPGAIIFYNNNIIKHIAEDGSIYWTGIKNPFPYTDKELADVGLKRFYKDDLIIIRPVGETIKADKLVYNLTYFDNRNVFFTEDSRRGIFVNSLESLVNEYKDFLNIENMEIPLEVTPIEALSDTLWQNLLDNPDLADVFGNAQEQKLYQKLNVNGYNTFFNKGYSRLNNTIIGGYNALDHVQNLYQKPGEKIVTHSESITRNTLAGLTAFILRSNRVTKYTSLFFNERYILSTGILKEMFKDETDESIASFFKSGDFKAAVLKETADGRPHIAEYKIYDRASLHRAIESKAILLPDSIYRGAKLTINYKGLDDTAWGLYKRIVMMTYKSLDLLTLGFLFRNAADSLGYKNINELGFTKAMKYNYTAIKMLKFHNDIQRQVLEATGHKTFNKETLFEVLKNYSKEEQFCYLLTDFFVNTPASGGYSKAFAEYLEEYNSVSDIRSVWEKWYTDLVFKKQWSPIHILNDVNDSIEQTARLGLFLGMLDKGNNINEAVRRVVKTHFDYTAKPTLMDFCEKIFWFSTFPINNLSYYLTDGLSKNPALLRTLMDAETASWNNGEYTYEELKKTNFLAYHAMTGNLRIGKYIIKLSPSVFDMLGLYTQPVTSIVDRLNPFLRIPLDLAMENNPDYNTLIPINTQLKNLKRFTTFITDPQSDEGSLIPSIISTIKSPGDTTYTHGGRRYTRYVKPQWTKYPRIKKNPNLMRRYTKKFYARDYRWWHNRGLLSSLNLNQFGTTLMDPEYLTKVKILRAMRSFNHQKNYLRMVRP